MTIYLVLHEIHGRLHIVTGFTKKRLAENFVLDENEIVQERNQEGLYLMQPVRVLDEY